ncbi:MAG: hypothetical protein HY514_03870 [Candidatus Aenigmarchaeota archaeon]|nr:hypothetical protein [Candidatus Aenigmarchaeota archaeon]
MAATLAQQAPPSAAAAPPGVRLPWKLMEPRSLYWAEAALKLSNWTSMPDEWVTLTALGLSHLKSGLRNEGLVKKIAIYGSCIALAGMGAYMGKEGLDAYTAGNYGEFATRLAFAGQAAHDLYRAFRYRD